MIVVLIVSFFACAEPHHGNDCSLHSIEREYPMPSLEACRAAAWRYQSTANGWANAVNARCEIRVNN